MKAGSLDSPRFAVLDWARARTIVTVGQVPVATHLREQDDVVHDPADPDPARRFKLYLSASVTPSVSHVWLICSPDGTTWGEPVPCTVDGSPFVGEDPSITQTLTVDPHAYRDAGGRLVLFCENNGTFDIDAYTSTDGVAWSLVKTGAIVKGSPDSFEHRQAGSPIARHDGRQHLVGYEGIRRNPTAEHFCLAIGTTPSTLVKSAANPLISADDPHLPVVGTGMVVDSFWLTRTADRIVLVGHSGIVGSAEGMFRFHTRVTEPSQWKAGDFSTVGAEEWIDPTVRNDITAMPHGRHFLITAPNDDLSLVRLPLTYR